MSESKNPKKTLLSIEYPPGFDEEGRRLIERCEEFAVYELFKVGGKREVEMSEDVERALLRAMFRVNRGVTDEERAEQERRIEYALTLKKLERFSAWADEPLPAGAVPLARALAKTIGDDIATVMEADNITVAAQKAATRYKLALLAVAREAGHIPDGRAKDPFPRVAHLIWAAKAYFLYELKRPSKSELIKRLEYHGLGHKGKSAKAEWRADFVAAALDKLPE